MVASSDVHNVFFYVPPLVIGIAIGILYVKRGWPRANDPRSRRWSRTTIGVVVGLYVFGQAVVLAADNLPNPAKQSATKIDVWVSKYMLPEVVLVAHDVGKLNQGEAARSWVEINNACFLGVADIDASVGKPVAPNLHVRMQYDRWLVDELELFTNCQNASSTRATWLSSVGVTDWAKAMRYVPLSNAAYKTLSTVIGNATAGQR